jgi:hypothetical protein
VALLVGPVVGKVTSTSAVVLLEADSDAVATLTLVPTTGVRKRAPPLLEPRPAAKERTERGPRGSRGVGVDASGVAAEGADGDDEGEASDESDESDESDDDEDESMPTGPSYTAVQADGSVVVSLRLRAGEPASVECEGLQPGTTYRVDLVLCPSGGVGGASSTPVSGRGCATVRTMAPSGAGPLAMTLAASHDGLARASHDPRSPSPLDGMRRHAVPVKGGDGDDGDGLSSTDLGCRSPPWHLCLHLGGQLDASQVFPKVKRYVCRFFLYLSYCSWTSLKKGERAPLPYPRPPHRQ